jgi:uncharacterized protein (TIGR03083 family)
MSQSRVLEAFRAEAQAFSQVVAGLSEDEWDLPTRCEPWSVRELLGHVRVVIAWVPGMLATAPPVRAEVSAAEYYRPDDRFGPQTNAARISLAQEYAARQASDAAFVQDWTATWQRVDELCQAEPANRLVRTRHGDAMLLSQFLVTRVVEIAVHGLDVADALGREPWLTPQAAAVVMDLLLGPGQEAAAQQLDWNRSQFLRKATGREPLNAAEVGQVERLGIRWLTLG